MRSRMAGMCGAIFGACATIVQSTLTISPAGSAHAARRFGEQHASNRRPRTPRRCRGSGGRCRRAPAAPSSASVIACSSASASEWPSGRACAGSSRRRAPAAGRRRAHACPSLRRCAVVVMRRALPHARCSRRSASVEVGRPGELEVLELAAHELRREAERLDRARPRRSRRAGLRERLRAAGRGETSAASARPTCRARSSVAATRPVASCFSVSASGSASRPPTSSSAQASIRRSTHCGSHQAARGVVHQHPVVRRDAARGQLVQARWPRVCARVAPPQRATQPRSPANSGTWRSNSSSSRRQHDQRGVEPRAPAASAASVCATIARPAIGAYCFGPTRAGARADAGARHQRDSSVRSSPCDRSGSSGRF